MLFIFKRAAIFFLSLCLFIGFTSGCSVKSDNPVVSDNIQVNGKKISASKDVAETVKREISGAGPDESSFTFVVAGDNRPADDSLPQPQVFIDLLGHMEDINPVFFINTGDIINGGTDEGQVIIRQFSDYLEAVSKLTCISIVSPGNHDVANSVSRKYFLQMIHSPVFELAGETDIRIYAGEDKYIAGGSADMYAGTDDFYDSDQAKKHTEKLYYYFRLYDTYFVILDAYEPGQWGAIKNEQLAWLEEILKYLKNENVFVFIHPPPYSYLNPDCITDGSRPVSFSSRENQDHLRKLFREYGIDAVFSGHNHMYNRQNHDGTVYIITGCSGAYPYVPEEEGGFYHFLKIEVKKESWTLNVIDSRGDLFEREVIMFN